MMTIKLIVGLLSILVFVLSLVILAGIVEDKLKGRW